MNRLSQVDVDQFYGIEIGEWPARIAEVALWLMDHQMNLKVSEAFGQLYQRLPLKKSPHIHCANALRLDWKKILPPRTMQLRPRQSAVCWRKISERMNSARTWTPFAATLKTAACSITSPAGISKRPNTFKARASSSASFQQIQSAKANKSALLWNHLFQHFGLKIHFAHRTFPWASEARGKAHVHVVIIGFAAFDTANKRIYDYEGRADSPLPAASAHNVPKRRARSDAPDQPTDTITVTAAKNISPYLVEGTDLAILNRSTPICDVPEMGIGNKPIDDGNYLFTPEEKTAFLKEEPAAKEFFRRWIGAEEFINGIERWCLWLGDCPPEKLRQMPRALERVERVRKFRLASKSKPTKKIAARPTRFHVENMPEVNFLVVPEVSSERDQYIPIGFIRRSILASNKLRIVPNATLYPFRRFIVRNAHGLGAPSQRAT